MLLQETIDHALELTEELRTSLNEDRDETWEDVLARRADAMAEFRDAHREADEAVLTACGPSLVALAEADRELQLLAEEALAEAAASFRAGVRDSQAGAAAYDDDPATGSLDRQA